MSETIEASLIRHSNRIAELVRELEQIVEMSMGDGLDVCRSLTEPSPMTQREMVHHAPVIRAVFMGIAHKANAAICKAKGKARGG